MRRKSLPIFRVFICNVHVFKEFTSIVLKIFGYLSRFIFFSSFSSSCIAFMFAVACSISYTQCAYLLFVFVTFIFNYVPFCVTFSAFSTLIIRGLVRKQAYNAYIWDSLFSVLIATVHI
jgi:hypothetical protein